MDTMSAQYEALKTVDIRTLDPAMAVDIATIKINTDLPPIERMASVIEQMNGNPFVYRCGNILVKTSFAGTKSIQSILEDYLQHSK